MKRFLIVLLFLPACRKSENKPAAPFREFHYYPTRFYLISSNQPNIADTTQTLSDISFDELTSGSVADGTANYTDRGTWSNWFTTTSDHHIYTLRYIPSEPLIDTFKYYTDEHYGAGVFSINPLLIGKLIFEMYDTTEHKVYNRIYAGKGSSVFLNYVNYLVNWPYLKKGYDHFLYKTQTDTLYWHHLQ